jgi:uncharacterized protein YacL
MRSGSSSSVGSTFVELVRLAVVVLATGGAFGLGPRMGGSSLLVTLLGAGVGYVAGGIAGRFVLGRIDAAERRLRSVSSHELLAAVLGAILGLVTAAALTWPLLLFGPKLFTVAAAVLVALVLAAFGIRVGVARGGDLMRSLGATGRLDVTSPSGGARTKLVDTSALIDGRLVDVCRAGFLDGALLIPKFVLYELQGLADAGDDERRARGRRGLDVLSALQRSSGVALEVSDRDYTEIEAVDAKLVAMARDYKAGLLTVDGNLGRVAEVQGVKVLNLHRLAEHLRPPVLPGNRLEVRILKPGRERGQGVGYLSDGTMVVVEGGRDREGVEVTVEVTSILSNPNGRMVFATAIPDPVPTRLAPHSAAS